jgi:hypothetical protein
MFKKKQKAEKTREQEIRENDGINIFTPGIYHGKQGAPWEQKCLDVDVHNLIELVRDRAEKDGQWCIDMDLVGDNEDKMRRMMEYVKSRHNIIRNLNYQKETGRNETIDFLCRDLANGSRWAG